MYEGFTIKEAPLTLLTMHQQATLEKTMSCFSGKHGASYGRMIFLMKEIASNIEYRKC